MTSYPYPPLPEQHCSNCRYKRCHQGEDVCCIYAPSLDAIGLMPLVSAVGWCGEWAPLKVAGLD